MKLSSLFDHMRDRMSPGVTRRARPQPVDQVSGRRMLGRVAKVMVETWDTGPFPTDLCWLLADAEDRILFVLPTGVIPGQDLIDRIGDARGFDKAAIRRAMRSTRNARFTIWQRDRIADHGTAAR